MDFEKETIDCILQYNPEAEIDNRTESPELACKAVHVPGKNIVFHLIPIPFAESSHLPPTYFQEKSLEYARLNDLPDYVIQSGVVGHASLGIQLVHLWQDYWVTKQEIVRSRIAVLSGSGIRIHARQTKVQRITKDDMRSFFTDNHLQGSVNARYNYGLFAGGQLVAAASFSAGRTVTRNGVAGRSFELLRYASLLHHRVVGGLGKLIARFIKEVDPDDIMTYADLDWASGKGYQALNFEQAAVTPPQMFWVHPADMIRYYPHRLPAQLTDDFKRWDKHGSIDDFLKDMGYIKIHNAGNLKYLLIRGY